MPRKTEPRIVDPARHPKRDVCLTVAAEYLGMHARTLLARIQEGKLPAIRDGKVYRIAVSDLVRYERREQESL